jgi:hypothetical protein
VTTLTVRPLPTPHDPASGDVTVATPSCCCCCCCCLATLGTAVGFAAGATYETAVRRGGPRVVPTLVALLALPLALATLVVLLGLADDSSAVGSSDGPWERLAWVAAAAVYVLLVALPLTWAGARWLHAVGLPVLMLGAIGVGVVVELPLALVTAFLIELASPALLALGVWIGRSTHSTLEPPWPQPPGWPVVVGLHDVPPPPPDAIWGPPVDRPALPPIDAGEPPPPGFGGLPPLPAPPAGDFLAPGEDTPAPGEDDR